MGTIVDGAAADAEQRVAPEKRHHAAAEKVLQRDHHNGDGKAQDDSFAAIEQRGDTDREADGGEDMIIKTVCSVASKLMDAMPME